MHSTEQLEELASILNLGSLRKEASSMIHTAQLNKPSYTQFLEDILSNEIQRRRQRAHEKLLKSAHLPRKHDLDLFQDSHVQGITTKQLIELRQLIWMEQCYNIIIMGPSGLGKTYIAAGLVYEAVKQGKKGYLITLQELMSTIKMRDVLPSAMRLYNRYLKADLIAIDDIMLFPLKQAEGVEFFHFINKLYEHTPIIITSNKAPTEWSETIEDEVLTTALLDRLLYKCQVISLSGISYRMENQKTIF